MAIIIKTKNPEEDTGKKEEYMGQTRQIGNI